MGTIDGSGRGPAPTHARAGTTVARPVVWFEVEDLLRYYDHYPNPTGMQRVALEIFRAVERLDDAAGRVRYCRLSLYTSRFQAIGLATVLAAASDGPGIDAPWRLVPLPGHRGRELRKLLRALRRFPRYVARIAAPIVRDVLRPPSEQRRFAAELAPGDVMISLGGPWINRRYSARIAGLRRARGIRFVQLVHDVIPVLNPDWIAFFGDAYRRWLGQISATADLLLTVSESARTDLRRVAAVQGFPLPPVDVIRLGTDFQSAGAPAPSARTAIAPRLPESYVLCVSTIEVRKNHAFLFRVWRRLLDRHGVDAVPHLVLVGRIGHLVVDTRRFRGELAACNYLDGKLVLLLDLLDGELIEVYRRSRFTVYPSLYEGWGLPVAESLARGKFCVASNRASIPEVGGDLVDYFDPIDEEGAQRALERVLFQPGYLAAREARVRAEYRPPTWAECAQDLLGKLERLSRATTVTRPNP